MQTHDRESGLSLISVIVAVGLLGILATAVARLASNGIKAKAHISENMDLQMLKLNVMENFSCRASLGITETTSQPLNCAAYDAVPLRRRDLSTMTRGGKIGAWQVRATCIDDEIEIQVARETRDPLNNRDRSTWSDLFNGTSDLCRQYFSATNVACTQAPYTLFTGMEPAGPRCCRRVEDQGDFADGGFVSNAQCSSTEYVLGGGGICNTTDVGVIPGLDQVRTGDRMKSAKGFMHAMGIQGNGYLVNCYSASFDPSKDTVSRSYAICCPLP